MTSEDFTIVVLPDTQFYSESFPATYTAQTQWIMNNRDALNIEYVAHVGDIVNVASQINQWNNADAAMSLLETPVTGFPDGMPYCPYVGNHDIAVGRQHDELQHVLRRFQVPGARLLRRTLRIRQRQSLNLFSAGGMDFIVISLEYDTTPDQPVLDWADGAAQGKPEPARDRGEPLHRRDRQSREPSALRDRRSTTT